MIERLDGIILAVSDRKVTLQLGSFTLGLMVSNAHTLDIGTQVTLHTHLIWHQETGPNLFGFISIFDRSIFIMLTDCSGIGPKLALVTLESLGASGTLNAIYEGNVGALSSVSGIGEKKAEHIILHLKHKVGKLFATGLILDSRNTVSQFYEVESALQSLNYSRSEIQK